MDELAYDVVFTEENTPIFRTDVNVPVPGLAVGEQQPLRLYGADGVEIGHVVLSMELGALVGHVAFDFHTPERLDIETGVVYDLVLLGSDSVFTGAKLKRRPVPVE